jgi:hypothetical protein
LLLVLVWVIASTRPRSSHRIAATFNRHML